MFDEMGEKPTLPLNKRFGPTLSQPIRRVGLEATVLVTSLVYEVCASSGVSLKSQRTAQGGRGVHRRSWEDGFVVIDIFSKRDKPLPNNDVFKYNELPDALRVQIVHIWRSTLGDGQSRGQVGSRHQWTHIHDSLAREHGRFRLGQSSHPFDSATQFLLSRDSRIEQVLDLIEMSFNVIDTIYREENSLYDDIGYGDQSADDAIAELNHRFREHAVGYSFESGKIIRVDSTYTHAQVIKPTLLLLSDGRFRNAEEEFLAAHEAYREGRYSDCINESLKSFESTMKIICTQRGWTFQPTDTASKLIGIMLDNSLVAPSHQAQFTSLRQLLESGTPTVRNKNSGHGQGPTAIVIPPHLARYALNTAAANITLLVEAVSGTP
jgi:hypothetical protein